MLLSVGLSLGLGCSALVALVLSCFAIGVVAGKAPVPTCSPIDGIGRALRQCGVCSPVPPRANWVIADYVDGSRAQPGGQVQTRWDNGATPVRDSERRHAHIRGFMLRAFVEITVEGATNAAISAYQLRSLWESIFFENVAGWQFLSDVDGRTLIDDVYMRHGGHVQHSYLQAGVQGLSTPVITVNNGLPENVGAGTYVLDCSVNFPTVTLGPGRSKLKGLIPLASVQRWKNGGFKYRMGAQIAGAPPGVEITAYFQPSNPDQQGVEFWVDLVYLPTVVMDSYWQVDSYPLSDFNSILQNSDRRTEYAAIRYFPEDDGTGEQYTGTGQALADDLDTFTVQIGGMNVLGGENKEFMRSRGTDLLQNVRDSSWNRDNAAQDLPLISGAGESLIVIILGYQTRENAAAGDVAYRISEHPDLQEVRWLHRTDACHDPVMAGKIVRATRCGACVKDRPTATEDGYTTPTPNEPFVLKLAEFPDRQ